MDGLKFVQVVKDLILKALTQYINPRTGVESSKIGNAYYPH